MDKLKQGNSGYFESHWKGRDEMAYASTKLDVARSFLSVLADEKKPATVLDAGCGDGVHAHVINEVYGDSYLYCGIDVSIPATITADKRNPYGMMVAGDVQYLPFKHQIFDISFSYGVLAYTRSPKDAFAELCRVTRRGGLIGVWFYIKPNSIGWTLLSGVRLLVRVAPSWLADGVANLIVPFLAILPTSSRVNLSNASWEQCKEIVMVNIMPEELWYPGKDDVLDLFRNNNCEIVDMCEKGGMTVWGRKK